LNVSPKNDNPSPLQHHPRPARSWRISEPAIICRAFTIQRASVTDP
jgi:hypothetical protein